MEFAAAVLCDYAQVREGLLTVVSGGITRLYRPEIPTPAGVFFAVILELEPDDFTRQHEVRWTVKHAESATTVLSATNALQLVASGGQPGEPVQVPVVADLRGVVLPAYGEYDAVVTVDGEYSSGRSFRVVAPG